MNALTTRTWLALAFLAGVLAELPPYIKVCRRSDPQINECVMRSIEELRSKLAEGIPELNAPAIEPLYLKQMRLVRGPAEARLDVNLTNFQVSGPSKFKVRDLKVDSDNLVFTYKVGFDRLNFKGNYQINARVLLLRLNGQGDITGHFDDYDSDVVMKAHKVQRNNKVYIEFEKMKINIKVGKGVIHLSNLFNGDPVLGAAGNDLLNANSHLFLDEVRPVLQDTLADLFTNVANKITRSFTYDELFPQ